MKYCSNCGGKLEGDVKFCPKCGQKVLKKTSNIDKEVEEVVTKVEKKAKEILDTPKDKGEYSKQEKDSNKIMAVLSYLGFLALIPYFGEKESKYVAFHAKQGMTLFLMWIGYYLCYNLLTLIKFHGSCEKFFDISVNCYYTPWWITWPLNLLGIMLTVLSVIGIINVCNNEAKELPLVGKFKWFK